MTVSQAVTIARNLIQPTDGVPLCDSGMVNLIYARSLDAQRKKRCHVERQSHRNRRVKYANGTGNVGVGGCVMPNVYADVSGTFISIGAEILH